jgi:hypothetical protein
MNLFSDALSAGFAAMNDFAGTSATIRRGTFTTAVTCVTGREQTFVIQETGQLFADNRTFWIRADNYVFNGQAATPEEGDFVEITALAGLTRYRVLNNGTGCFSYAVPDKSIFAINTKKMQ